MSSDRPSIVYSDDGPEPPYPYRMEGIIEKGFGRGSSELGIPTANLPVDASLTPWIADIKSGVYFGYASLALPPGHKDCPPPPSSSPTPTYHIYPMVMSIGYNPYYKNTVRSAEVHVLYEFKENFYHVPMRVLLLGFIREEKDYEGLEALIRDIKFDCDVARNSLRRKGWTPREGLAVDWPAAAKEGTLDGSWLVSSTTTGTTKTTTTSNNDNSNSSSNI